MGAGYRPEDHDGLQDAWAEQNAADAALSYGGLKDTVLEAFRALYGATTMVTGNKVTAQRCMPEGGEWLFLRFNDAEALKRASDALTLLEQNARRLGA